MTEPQTRTIKVDALARVEGEGALYVRVKDGEIKDLKFRIFEPPRFFEALLRGRDVTVTGTPFYAGWGLTRDLGRVPARRQARPSVAGLAHAALIDYPRYFDPVTGQACSVETAVRRLSEGPVMRGGPVLRLLAKAQGVMAGMSWVWR